MKLFFLLLLTVFSLDAVAYRRLPYCNESKNNATQDCINVATAPKGWGFYFVPGTPAAMKLTVALNLSDASAGSVLNQFQTVQNTIAAWNTQGNANFLFSAVQGSAPIPNIAVDGINIVVERNVTSGVEDALCQTNVLGFSAPQNITPTYSILEADMVVCDKQFTWFANGLTSNSPDDDQHDLMSLLLHELGHHFGLGHSNFNGNPSDCDDAPDTVAAMDTCVLEEEFSRRTLSNDDIKGIQAIYGAYNPDPDSDGILNQNDNCPNMTNKNQADFDQDGQGDVCDYDADNDGLPNESETKLGSNPLKLDSDEDGLNDGDEVKKYESSPTQKDSDGDSLEDGDEVKAGTNPSINEPAIVAVTTTLLLDDDCTYYPEYKMTDCEFSKMVTGASSVFEKMTEDIKKANESINNVYKKMMCSIPFFSAEWCKK